MNLGRALRTVRRLRAAQIVGQLRLQLRGRPGPRAFDGPVPALALGASAVPFLPSPPHAFSDGWRRFRLIAREAVFVAGPDWEFTGHGPLFAYHLHQFDWLRHPGLTADARRAVVIDWIERHTEGVGWDAAPISLRTLNWLRCALTPGALPLGDATGERILRSLGAQLDTLAGALETHLLGNHYLWNLIALVFAGHALAGPAAERWRAFGPRLERELATQILSDGAHEERTPTYHALLLENVLDLLNLQRAGVAFSPGLIAALEAVAARMLGALGVFTLPDGELALFGDSALAIAHPPVALEGRATRLGVARKGPPQPGVLDAAGFARLERGPFVLLASLAGPSPAHQPGHAHGDALAFELTVGSARVITDTGVCEYVPGPLRDLSRATRSHATLEIDGFDQAEFWGAHRVGGRPRVRVISVSPDAAAEALAEATCAGWATPDTTHRRLFRVRDDAVEIEDRLEGHLRPVRAALPLAPGLEPRLDGRIARLRLPDGRWLRIDLAPGLDWRCERAPYFPTFGRSLQRHALVGRGTTREIGTTRITLARSLSE